MGVALYCAAELDKAVDCFSTALQARGDDARLWNRLGATLANGGHSERALAMYERALALKPNYVRARYNLAVSCMNIGVLDQAAGYLLTVLKQTATSSVSVHHVWDTLRRVCLQMHRRELADLCLAAETNPQDVSNHTVIISDIERGLSTSQQ